MTIGADRHRACSSRTPIAPTSGCSTSSTERAARAADDRPRPDCRSGRTCRREYRRTARRSRTGTRVTYGSCPPLGVRHASSSEGSSPIWIDDGAARDLGRARGHNAARRHSATKDPWPRRLATGHGELDEHGDEGEATVSPDGSEVAYMFTPRADLNRSEIRVASLESGAVRALTGTPRMHDRGAAWSPDGEHIAYTSERSGFYEIHLVARDGSGDRQLTSAQRRPRRARLAPRRRRGCSRCAAAATASTSWWST